MNKLQKAAKEAGGILNVYKFNKLDLGSGCGNLTYVSGTNGGKMPCGGKLKWLTGEVTVEYCPECQNKMESFKLWFC